MLCFLVIFLVQVVFISAHPNDDCQTPGGNHGRCVLVRDCPFIRELQTKVRNAEDNSYLFRFKCGTEPGTRKPLVCCPTLRSASDCGRITLHDKIVGGEETEPNEFPWTVQLAYDKAGSPLIRCGGSLINDRYVLTAAHCVVDVRSYELKAVRLGEWDTTTLIDCKEEDTGINTCNQFPHRDIEVVKVIPHELYSRRNPNQEHDIALLKLSKAAPKTESIGPICLPTAEMANALWVETQLFTVAGWGATNSTEEFSYRPVAVHASLIGAMPMIVQAILQAQ